ncbi:PASTA domain-containing protein [Ruminococcus flavefaciens]|uniref:PASTA domain-containing protein n=1 Tax=Ruminococcus flavefaciens TaxID=1265 RepID=UPI0026E9A6B0|nr:PASTA domain-containing protein [Ruminococcus flavefaciens]
MNDKELGLDILENADDEEIRRIAADCPVSSEEMERMFKLSRKTYNERTNESKEAHAVEVSGVEQYKKPIWHKIVSAAAALALVAGLGTGGYFLARHRGSDNHFAGGEDSQVQEVNESNYPFGEIDRVRMISTAIAPAAVELEPEQVSELASLLNKLQWKEIKDKEPAEGEFSLLYIYNNNDPYLLMVSMMDSSIMHCKLTDGEIESRLYSGSDELSRFLNTIELEPEKLLYDIDDFSEDTIREVWTYEHRDISVDAEGIELPDFTAMNVDLVKEQLKIRGLNCEVKKQSSSEVLPNYVIRTEPEAGEKLKQGDTVILYVSMGSDGTAVEMPDFTGMTVDDAAIRSGYLGLKVITEYVPSSEHIDTVVRQSPEAGTEVASGENITLYISMGEFTDGAVTHKVTVPDGINGRYAVDFIWTDRDGITKVESSGNFVLPEYGNEVLTEISGKGNGCEATAYLTNLSDYKRAIIGHYIFNFDNGTYTIEDEDIEGAFNEVQ